MLTFALTYICDFECLLKERTLQIMQALVHINSRPPLELTNVFVAEMKQGNSITRLHLSGHKVTECSWICECLKVFCKEHRECLWLYACRTRLGDSGPHRKCWTGTSEHLVLCTKELHCLGKVPLSSSHCAHLKKTEEQRVNQLLGTWMEVQGKERQTLKLQPRPPKQDLHFNRSSQRLEFTLKFEKANARTVISKAPSWSKIPHIGVGRSIRMN